MMDTCHTSTPPCMTVKPFPHLAMSSFLHVSSSFEDGTRSPSPGRHNQVDRYVSSFFPPWPIARETGTSRAEEVWLFVIGEHIIEELHGVWFLSPVT